MREQLDEQLLDNVVGGTVIISKDYMVVGFSTIQEKYNLKNCTYKQIRDYIEDLLDDNPNLSNEEFDLLAKQNLQSKGWI